MRFPKSKIGLALSFLYFLGSLYLIVTQGLFGESFIVIILGLPWSYFMIYFQRLFTISEKSFLFIIYVYVYALLPVLINIILLYWIGIGIEKLFFKRK